MYDAIGAEWIKLRSLRSTPALLVIGLTVTVLTGLLFGLLIGPEFQRATPADRMDFDPVGLSFTGMQLGQLAVVVLAVLAVGSEFGSGMIRTSLAAVPRRGRLLTAKFVLLGSIGLAWGLVTGAASLLVGTWALGADLAELPPGDLLRTVSGAGAYAALLAVSAGSVTFMVRRNFHRGTRHPAAAPVPRLQPAGRVVTTTPARPPLAGPRGAETDAGAPRGG